jgi:hypothetical protein
MKLQKIETLLNIVAEEIQTAAQHVRDYRTSGVPFVDDLTTAEGLVAEAMRQLGELHDAIELAYQARI